MPTPSHTPGPAQEAAPTQLHYISKATKQRHGMAGYLYRQSWATGYQNLVLTDRQHKAFQASKR